MRLYERYMEIESKAVLIFELQKNKSIPIASAFTGATLLASSCFFYEQNGRLTRIFYPILFAAGLLGVLAFLMLHHASWRLVIAHDRVYTSTRRHKKERIWNRNEIQQILLFCRVSHDGKNRGPYPWRVDFVTTKATRSRSGLKFKTEAPAREIAQRLATAMELTIKEKCA